MTSAPEAHKTAGVPPEVIKAAAKAMFEHLGGTRFADDLQGVYATIYPEGFRTLAMIALGAAGVTGIATRLGRPLTVEEDAELLEAEWSGSEAAVSRVTNRILASRSTPSVPAVAELSGGLALGVAGAAEGNLLTAAKKALAFYDSLDREHDPGEAAVLDALDTAVRAALTASPAGDDPKAGLPQVPASGAAAGWMPISSAPRDGTRILAVENFKRVSMDEDGNVTREHPEDMEVVFWSEKMGAWVGYGMALMSFEPTHWTPRPQAPALEGGSNG